MSLPTQPDSRDEEHVKHTSLWGEIAKSHEISEESLYKKPLILGRGETRRGREAEDAAEEEPESHDDTVEEEEESGEESGEDDGSSAASEGPPEIERHLPPSSLVVPFEIEALINAAYKPEGPKVVFPLRTSDPLKDAKEDDEVPYEYCRHNDIVHHTIRLNQHYRVMTALLHIAQNTKGTEFMKFPPIPDMIIRKRKLKRFRRLKFSVPVYQHPKPYLEELTIQKMLQKAVVIILAQLGVDKATRSVVLVLVDVVKEFLRKLCLTCNTYCQWDLTRGHLNFQAIMHRSLVDMGLRKGQEDIREYCESIVTRRNRAFRRTFHLVRLYLKTVYAARMKARLLGTPAAPTRPRLHKARSMLPQQGLSVYLPRGMQTITVMERTRPYIRKYQEYPTAASAPILASKFASNYGLVKRDTPPELSAILRPSDISEQ